MEEKKHYSKDNLTIWIDKEGYYTVYDKCGFVADGWANAEIMKTDNPAKTIYLMRTTIK